MPLHTRMIRISVEPKGSERIRIDSRITDIRKRGIVTFGGRPRGPGVIHDMTASLEVDRSDLRIVAIEPGMHVYPFHATAETGGESCADRIADVGTLVGVRLTGRYGDALAERIGGPLGCFHVFTLLRLVGPTVCHLETTRGLDQPFSRTILADALGARGNRIELHGSLCDLHLAGPAGTRLESASEAAVSLAIELPGFEISAASGRTRTAAGGEPGVWEQEARLERLTGLNLRKGFSVKAQELLGDPQGSRPLTHLVFMLAPVAMQAMPAFLAEIGWQPPRGTAPGHAGDSCHMWRIGGPLHTLLSGGAGPGNANAGRS